MLIFEKSDVVHLSSEDGAAPHGSAELILTSSNSSSGKLCRRSIPMRDFLRATGRRVFDPDAGIHACMRGPKNGKMKRSRKEQIPLLPRVEHDGGQKKLPRRSSTLPASLSGPEGRAR